MHSRKPMKKAKSIEAMNIFNTAQSPQEIKTLTSISGYIFSEMIFIARLNSVVKITEKDAATVL